MAKKAKAAEARVEEKKPKKLHFREVMTDGKVYIAFHGTKLPKRIRNHSINNRPMFKEDVNGFFGCTEKKWPIRKKIMKRMGFKVSLERVGLIETLEEALTSLGTGDGEPLDVPRVTTGYAALDRLFGGKDHEKIGFGLPQGTLTILNGEPGCGKSTTLTQMALKLANHRTTLYITSEETKVQLIARLSRMAGSEGFTKRQVKYLKILCTRDINVATARVKYADAEVLIVDSIQGFGKDGMASTPKDWKRSFGMIVNYVKAIKPQGIAIGVSQVTKDGEMAGPKAFEHDCDINLCMSGSARLREIEPTKNRYNATFKKLVVAMTETGLEFTEAREVDRPEMSGVRSENRGTTGDWEDMES